MRGNTPATASEVWFDAYLHAQGYSWEPEPDLGIPKRPDRLIHRDGLSAVCEVKQFDKNPLAWMPRARVNGRSWSAAARTAPRTGLCSSM